MKEFTVFVGLVLCSFTSAQDFGEQLYYTNFTLILEKAPDQEVPGIQLDDSNNNDTQQNAASLSNAVDEGPDFGEVERWLTGIYGDVIGFKEVTVDEDNSRQSFEVSYSVSFDMEELSRNNSFTSDSFFIQQLQEKINRIVEEDGEDPADGWVVETEETLVRMNTELLTVQSSFRAENLCVSDAICPDRGETCDLQNGELICEDKCSVFERRYPGCTRDPRLDLIYVTGECVLDEDFNPICDCGTSPGDILDNFFDGTECVSAAFVVGMAAAGAGFIFVVLLSAVIGLAVTKCNQTKKIDQLEAELVFRAESNWAAPKPDDRDEYVNIEMTNKSATGSDKNVHSYPPNIYTNQAYTEDEKPSNQAPNGVSKQNVSEDPSFGGTDSEFVPQLRHIDPTADYSIKRPSVTIRPTDPFSNDRNSGSYRESAYL